MIEWLGSAPLLERFVDLTYEKDAPTWGDRLTVYRATWEMVKDFPLFGIGYEAFPVIFPRYQPEAIRLRYLQAHNDFLQLLAETGWIGFILLIGGIVLLLADIIKRWQRRHDPFVQVMVPAGLAALGAIGLHSLVDFNLRIPANALLCTVVLALTCACANLPRGRSVRRGV